VKRAVALAATYLASLGFWWLVLYAAVTWTSVARAVALVFGGAVAGCLAYLWIYTAGYRAGRRWNDAEVVHLRGQRAAARRQVRDALEQVDDAMAEVAASWRREEMRRG